MSDRGRPAPPISPKTEASPAAAPANDDAPRGLHSGLQVLAVLARHWGLDLSPSQLAHEHGAAGILPAERLATIAREEGLRAKSVRLDWERLQGRADALPCAAVLRNGEVVLVAGFTEDGRIRVLDPQAASAKPLLLDRQRFEAAWAGQVLLISRDFRLADPERRFDLRWFLGRLLQERSALRDVVAGAFAIHLLALAVPIFFQIVVDRVLVHHSWATLQVLVVGVVLAILFEALVGWLRGLLLLHAVRRVDIRTTTHVFRHLLSLPTLFFGRTTAGVLTKHLQQTENIRQFLTGQSLTTLIDLTVLLVVVPLLLFYSPLLTAVVMGFALLLAGVIGCLIGPYRRRLDHLYRVEGERQAVLVESITGVSTVKSLALEPWLRRRWNELAAESVTGAYRVGRLALAGRTLSHLLEQGLTVAIIGVGVFLVFDQRLTVGALIAFNMLSNRVTGPLVQLVALIQSYQQTAVAVKMLGQVMNAKAERDPGAHRTRPPIVGRIDFRGVGFTYPDRPSPALDGVDLSVPAGAFIGVVGPSGSGKTTLSRLVQALHLPESGAVLIDGIDTRDIDLTHLRSNIGVVLQESFLFRGTIRDNIAATRSDASFEEVIEAARLAGADEFIQDLPLRYDTPLTEGGSDLSGGQRQRIAIARALLRQPPVLILDEATSALDPDSEAVVQRSLRRIAARCTLLVVSHRLSMVREADRILVMHKGRIVDQGSHRELLMRNELYLRLWQQQMAPQSPGRGDP